MKMYATGFTSGTVAYDNSTGTVSVTNFTVNMKVVAGTRTFENNFPVTPTVYFIDGVEIAN